MSIASLLPELRAATTATIELVSETELQILDAHDIRARECDDGVAFTITLEEHPDQPYRYLSLNDRTTMCQCVLDEEGTLSVTSWIPREMCDRGVIAWILGELEAAAHEIETLLASTPESPFASWGDGRWTGP